MQTFPIVELEVPMQPLIQRQTILLCVQVVMLVLDVRPQPLHEYVVDGPVLAVHADPDTFAMQQGNIRLTGELAPLDAVRNLGLTMEEYDFGDDPNDLFRRYAVAQAPILPRIGYGHQ